MCGIIGGNLFPNSKSIRDAQKLIRHRGWEAHDALSIDGFWMGHNRLSIQDLTSSANQPMWDSTERYCIVFNGELWKNTMKKFNQRLRKKYDFKTNNSDTEVFLYAYIEYGTSVFKDIDGMFSATIYDSERKKVIMVRDWVGRLPFYYLCKYDGLAFSSEMKSLTETFTDSATEVSIVEPSHYYEYDLNTGKLSDPIRYFNI